MAEVTYNPANTDVASTFMNTASGMQSIMGRAQQMRINQEESEMRKRTFDVMAPSMEAKSRADIAVANATLQTFEQQQRLRARFGVEAPTAQKEYEAAMQLPEFGQQAQALSMLHQKYSWMGLLPEGQPFVENIGKSQIQANGSYTIDKNMANQRLIAEENTKRVMEAQNLRNQQADENNLLKKEIAAMRLEAEQKKAQTRFNASDPLALNQRALELEQAAQEETDPNEKQAFLTSAKQFRDRAIRVTRPIDTVQSLADIYNRQQAPTATPQTQAPATVQQPVVNTIGDVKFKF